MLFKYFIILRFPNAVGIYWDNLFPSCTHALEINLVANLIVYNPKNRLRAFEVCKNKVNTNYLNTSMYIYAFAGT